MGDERPAVWIGHAAITVSDVPRAARFWEAVGMRTVFGDGDVAIFELRGGTHLVVVPGEPDPAAVSFDLMVEDLDATHAAWSKAGLDTTPIERGNIHDHFTVRDPDGHAITVNSTHVLGAV